MQDDKQTGSMRSRQTPASYVASPPGGFTSALMVKGGTRGAGDFSLAAVQAKGQKTESPASEDRSSMLVMSVFTRQTQAMEAQRRKRTYSPDLSSVMVQASPAASMAM